VIPALDSPRQFHHYRLYGISLRSEIPLSLPEEAQKSFGQVADATFFWASRHWFAEVIADLPHDSGTDGWYERVRCPDGAEFLRWPDLFQFLVSHDGRFVACGLLEHAALESFQTYLLGHVLSFALVTQGYEPLHATTVVVDGRAVAFLGHGGDGKSTLAAEFLHAGHQILTDDLLLIGEVDGTLCGFPGPPRIKLFPHIARRFLPRLASGAPVYPEAEKLIFPLAQDQQYRQPAPLRLFFRLNRPGQDVSGVGLASLSGAHALLELVRSTFNVRIAGRDRLRRQFLAVREWATRIPVRRLGYPRTLEMLEPVRRAIVTDLQSAGSGTS
jgi:hypothetical protein